MLPKISNQNQNNINHSHQTIKDSGIKTNLILKYTRIREKIIFLHRCAKHKIILPSMRSKIIDDDLVHIQLRRNIEKTLSQRNEIRRSIHISNRDLYEILDLKIIKREIYRSKKHFKNKFNRLKHCQTQEKKPPKNSIESGKKNNNKQKRSKCWKKRKKFKKDEKLKEEANLNIWNLSSYNLSLPQKELLLKGLNFAPTPKYSDIETSEWEQAAKVIRKVKLHNAHNKDESFDGLEDIEEINEEREESEPLPMKLKVQKWSVPKENSEETAALCNFIETKLRTIKSQVNNITPNLSPRLRLALLLLRRQKDIVIASSDKDGKTLVLNKEDFINICKNNMGSFKALDLGRLSLDSFLENSKKNLESWVRELFQLQVIDQKQLFGTIGEYYKPPTNLHNGKFEKTRIYSQHFDHRQKYANLSPLFKTHKLKHSTYPGPTILPPDKIPIRLVTCCTQALTSRATALLQMIYGNLCSEMCGTEFCQDTPDYLRSLKSPQYSATLKSFKEESTPDKQLFIVALDVQGLYPNSPRHFVLQGLQKILLTKFSKTATSSILALTDFCLENTVIALDNKPFTVTEGILTGASNSTSLADAFLTQITQPIRNALEILLFKRFIDDIIIHIYCSKTHLNNYIDKVKAEFLKYSMIIEERVASGSDSEVKEVEFLDVNHIFTAKNEYETYNYVKPTAKGRKFLSGDSFHPNHIFKGIIGGESKRLRRLNSTDDGWFESLRNLELKCNRSGFNAEMTAEMILKIRENDVGQEQALQLSEKDESTNDVIWATSIPNKLLGISNQQHKLLEKDAKLTAVYKKPPTLHSQIPACHHRKILNPPKNQTNQTGTQPCGKCKCCTNKFGAVAVMIKTQNTNKVYSSTGTEFTLKAALNCKDSGIYQLRCRECLKENRKKAGVYVGMTIKNFNTRMSGHRSNFKNNIDVNDQSDKYALARHYKEKHKNLRVLPTFEEAYELNFLEQPLAGKIREAEDKWSHKLGANINVQKMVTAKVR